MNLNTDTGYLEQTRLFQTIIMAQNNMIIELNETRNIDLKETNKLLKELLEELKKWLYKKLNINYHKQ